CFAVNGTCLSTGSGSTFTYPFPAGATTTLVAFNGGATFAGATTTALAVTGSTTISGQLNAVGGIIGNLTGNASTVTTNANLSGVVTSVGNTTSFGSFTSATLAGALSDETGNGAVVFGTNASLTNTTLASTTLTGNTLITNATTTSFAISNVSNALLKTLTNGSVTAAVAGTDYVTPAGLSAATVFPFTPGINFGVAENATSTPIFFTKGIFASTTSQFDNSTTSLATIGSLYLPSLVLGELAVDANGHVYK